MIIFWYSCRIWQTPEFVKSRAKFFSPRWTIALQKRFRSSKLDRFTSFFWLWIFGISLIVMFLICLFQGERAWRIGIGVLGGVTTSMTIQLLFPVIVPIRYPDFDVPIVGYEAIRLEKFQNTDKINGLLYNGLPSNHMGMIITGAWIALYVNNYDPWIGWVLIAFIFFAFTFIFAFSVIYLGEHYLEDMVASFIVYPLAVSFFERLSYILVP